MNKILSIAALLACCGAAVAQDSVSTNPDGGNGLPGDAPDAFSGGTVESYVLDLAPLVSSWGNQFAIGPILKTARVSTGASGDFFNTLPSANSMSQTVLEGVSLQSSSYDFWNVQGAGVDANNSAGSSLDALTIEGDAERIDQVAAHVASFATNNNPGDTEFNGVTAAIINFDPTNPTRLYVTRVESAINEPAFGSLPTAAIAAGGIDAAGNAFIRADESQSGGPNSLTGQNYFRVRNQDRGSVLNQIDNAGGADATDDMLRGFTTADPTTAASIIPEDVGLAGGSLGASNFQSNYKWGNDLASVTANATTAHFGAADDARGSVGWFRDQFSGLGASNVGTGAIASKTVINLDGGGTDDVTNAISIYGTAADGAITGQDLLVIPGTVSDGCDGFAAVQADNGSGEFFGAGSGEDYWEFGGFGGVTPFRGAPGTVAVGFDSINELGMAGGATVNSGLVNTLNNPRGAIHVVRFDPANPGDASSQNWALAGWTDFDARTQGAPAEQWGKPIRDGANGAIIGTMVDLIAVTQGGTTIPGPATSAPVFDAAGNIYFVTAAQLFKQDQMGVPFVDFDSVLVRGVKRELGDGEFCYDLELVLEPGDIFAGLNSATDYQIGFIGVAIGAGGRNPQTLWGNSGNNVPLGGADQSYAQEDPRNMTGLILAASITYDVDGMSVGGMGSRFNSPAGDATNPSPDESYQVLLYVSPAEGASLQAACGPDITVDGACTPGAGDGIVTLSDFSCYLSQWAASAPIADITLTGVCDFGNGGDGVDLSDFSCYLAEWAGGCDGDPGTPAIRSNGRSGAINSASLR